jgi:hypothetical protein
LRVGAGIGATYYSSNQNSLTLTLTLRWFTRGEFTDRALPPEGENNGQRGEPAISPKSSIFSFTNSFDLATKEIYANPRTMITIDGGPHTFWWPTQEPDGRLNPNLIPTPQIIREIQPNAKFIITLSDPVHRLYSDYYFLNDDRTVAHHGPIPPNSKSNPKPNPKSGPKSDVKSSKIFDERVKLQINDMHLCIEESLMQVQDALVLEKFNPTPKEWTAEDIEGGKEEGGPLWVRAAQMCAHDRYSFGQAGWGRLSIGLYSLYLVKWLENFSPDQFIVVRLEDYESNPRSYMERIFNFLEVKELDEDEWEEVLNKKKSNEYHGEREPIWEETEVVLRDFYMPYNRILADLVDNQDFLWENKKSLRESQIEKIEEGRRRGEGEEVRGVEGLNAEGGRERERESMQSRKDTAIRDRQRKGGERGGERGRGREGGREGERGGEIGGRREGGRPGRESEGGIEDHRLDQHGMRRHFTADTNTNNNPNIDRYF